jgi:hypothetical protein
MADVTSPFGFPYPEDTDLVRDGASDIENLAEGVNDYLAGGYLYAGTVYFTSSGSFLKADPLGGGDIGLRAIRVRMVGGGGGSGGAIATLATQVSASGGGGGGGYSESFITDIAGLPSSVTVTRGSGGSGGAAGNNAGSAGGGSSFDALVTSPGGVGGAGGFAASSASVPILGAETRSNASGTGDFAIASSETEGPMSLNAASNGAIGSSGSASLLSPRRAAGRGDAALSGLIYGGGASGNSSNPDTAARAGASGANGIVIVDCFV